jgi:flagellar hook protein FlgE
MSLLGSLTAAVSGLNAQQASIGNISNNIANSQTVGYKEVDTSFSELVTSSSASVNEPGGVIAAPVYQNAVNGSLTQTNTETDLAIAGNGFFQVATAQSNTLTSSTPAFSTATNYTRRGDFTLDKNGYLVNGAGYYLEGKSVNPTTGTVNSATTAPIQISQLINNPVPTSNVNVAANLPSSYALTTTPITGATASPYYEPDTSYVTPSPVQEQIYDSNGATHQANIQFNHVSANVWTADISLAGSDTATGSTIPYQVSLVFSDGSGNGAANQGPAGTLYGVYDTTNADLVYQGATATPPYVTQATGTTAPQPSNSTTYPQLVVPSALTVATAGNPLTGAAATIPAATITAAGGATALLPEGEQIQAAGGTSNVYVGPTNQVTGGTASFSLPFDLNPTAATLTATPPKLGLAQPVSFNFGSFGETNGITQFADKTVQVSSLTQDGIPRGSFQSLSIDESGNVSLNYNNGKSLTYYQIQIAQFDAPDQLQRSSGGAFTATLSSGSPNSQPPGTNGAGTISPQTLENSNVDIASQFTQLIVSQQAYSANAKVITTTDQLLQTVIGLIQG